MTPPHSGCIQFLRPSKLRWQVGMPFHRPYRIGYQAAHIGKRVAICQSITQNLLEPAPITTPSITTPLERTLSHKTLYKQLIDALKSVYFFVAKNDWRSHTVPGLCSPGESTPTPCKFFGYLPEVIRTTVAPFQVFAE